MYITMEIIKNVWKIIYSKILTINKTQEKNIIFLHTLILNHKQGINNVVKYTN